MIRVALAGAGFFGKNHARVLSELPAANLAGILDTDEERACVLAAKYGCAVFRDFDEAASSADCAVVATPTSTHEQVACAFLERGLDVLVEKPIATTSAAGESMAQVAARHGRILQVGHLERFNPAVTALLNSLSVPLFFEIHRMSVFTPRSLDVDVVLDLMIHDLDIVLACTQELPQEIQAAGISVLSDRVDIANVRLSFASGCVANLTASRVSTEKIRKLRLFQPGEYISLDYQRQEAVRLRVPDIRPVPLPVTPGEPLRLELESFLDSVKRRAPAQVTAEEATSALRAAERILDKIKAHTALVHETVRRRAHIR